MHLRCVCVLLLVGVNVTWAGLTRELSSCFSLVNFKISEGHNTALVCIVIFTILRFSPTVKIHVKVKKFCFVR